MYQMAWVGIIKGSDFMSRFEIVTPVFENTIMKAYYDNEDENVLRYYDIAPVEGYILHDNTLDVPEIDEGSFEKTGNIILGYTPSSISVSARYDFETNPREIYAVLRNTKHINKE